MARVKGLTFGIAPKVTKGLGPKPPKAENPSGTPKIRKLAWRSNSTDFLAEYRLDFLLRNAFSGKGPGVTGVVVASASPQTNGNRFKYRTLVILNIKGLRKWFFFVSVMVRKNLTIIKKAANVLIIIT